MFENLSMIFNWADKSKITLTRVTDNKMQGNFYSECSGVVVDQDFEAKDLFEFFIKLSLFTEDFGRILHTADEFEKNYFNIKGERYRRFTPREVARIQSFPEEFRLIGSEAAQYKALGNAIPPVMFWYVANKVNKILMDA